jgi:DNA-binding XRE family transcriptional regulator
LWYDERATGRRVRMDKKEFSRIRRRLRKTQSEMAQLLGVSAKAIQSFEQGWRNIPVHIERQALFLTAKETSHKRGDTPCWVIVDCPMETKQNCPAWEFKSGELCWFINGTICHGEVQKSWHQKMRMCRQCKVFRPILSSI